jgi:LysR family transcriptional regulator, nod-box dependent transcriptional activator
MHLRRFDLNLLLALDALLREKNVTRAAERVFVSQPAMSVALSKLRGHFNDPLLVRVGRELELTPRGLALVEPVREMLIRAQAVLGTQPLFDLASAKRTFRIMIPDFVAVWLLPRVLPWLSRWAPGVQLHVENWSATGPVQLVHGDTDFVVALDSPQVLGIADFPDSLCRATLQSQRWVCAAWSEHPELHDGITHEQFLNLPHICMRVPGDRQPIDEAIHRRLNIELDVRVATDNVLQIPFLLPGTPLIALLPEMAARQLAGCLAIRLLDVPEGIMPDRRVDLFWHRRSEPDPGHAWMRSALLDGSKHDYDQPPLPLPQSSVRHTEPRSIRSSGAGGS